MCAICIIDYTPAQGCCCCHLPSFSFFLLIALFFLSLSSYSLRTVCRSVFATPSQSLQSLCAGCIIQGLSITFFFLFYLFSVFSPLSPPARISLSDIFFSLSAVPLPLLLLSAYGVAIGIERVLLADCLDVDGVGRKQIDRWMRRQDTRRHHDTHRSID